MNKRKIMIILIATAIILLLGIIIYNVCIKCPNKQTKEEIIKIEDINTSKELINYLKTIDNDKKIKYEVKEDSGMIIINKTKDNKTISIVTFNKDAKQLEEDEVKSLAISGD